MTGELSWPEGIAAQAASIPNLSRAWLHIKQRQPGPGIDKVTVERYARAEAANIKRLSEALLSGRWKPKPGLKLKLKSDEQRRITIPTIEDRIVQRALSKALSPVYEQVFLASNLAYRPGRSVQSAIGQIHEAILSGRYTWAVRTDITQFFDRIDQRRLMMLLEQDQMPEQLRRWIRQLLLAGALEHVSVVALEGVGQGSALAPLLSNIYLRQLDEQLHDEPMLSLRYADDLLLLCADRTSALEAQAKVASAVSALGLSLNLRKTQLTEIAQGFDYLGAAFYQGGFRASKDAMEQLRARARACISTAPTAAVALELLEELIQSWQAWYDKLEPSHVDSLEVLLGCTLALGELEPWAHVRTGRLRHLKSSPRFHLEMALRWAAAANKAPTSQEVLAEAAALDLLAALDGELDPEGLALLEAWSGVKAQRWQEVSSGAQLAHILSQSWHHALAAAALEVDHGQQASSTQGAAATSASLITLIMERFRGRPELHCQEELNARGQRVFVPVGHPIDELSIRRHIDGAQRCGVYLCDEQGECGLFVLQVYGRGEDAATQEQLYAYALELYHAGKRLGITPLIEQLSEGGYKLWVRLAKAASLPRVRRVMKRWEGEAPSPPQGVELGHFPSISYVRKGPGPFIALPLWQTDQAQHRSALWMPGQDPQAPLEERLEQWPELPARAMTELLNLPASPALEQRQSIERVLALMSEQPAARQIISRCEHISALACKANALGVLDPIERATLTEVFAHLEGDEGFHTLEALLRDCARYDEGRIRRRLRTMGPYPLSCQKIKERHAGQLDGACCECQFGALPPALYPSPVLHGLDRAGLKRLYQRMREGWTQEKTLRDSPNQAPQAPELAAVPSPPSPTAQTNAHVPAQEQLEGALKRLINCKRQVDDAQRGLEQARAQLRSLLQSQQRVKVQLGWLVHRPGQEPEFIIELA